MRFVYPAHEQIEREAADAKDLLDASLDPQLQDNQNLSYLAAGDAGLRPVTLFDNGRYTFIKFSESGDWPAIFHVQGDQETLVNPTVRGNWLILPRVAPFWRLRLGEQVLCIKNEDYQPSAQDNETHTVTDKIQRRLK